MTRHPPEGWRPRLVALDIDGTVVGGGHGGSTQTHQTASIAVRNAVDRVVAAGVPVVLATGRSVHGVIPILDHLGLPTAGGMAYAVAANGSVTFSYPPAEVLTAETFDAGPAVRMLLEQAPNARVAVEEVGIGYRLTEHFPDGEITGEMTLQSLDEVLADPVTRVIIRDPHASEEDFLVLAEGLGLHGINYFVGWTAWLDLAPQGVSKAFGLESVCARLGVPASDVLAIGDGRNDVEMLAWAGRGVAMGQAPLEVQTAADDVTETVDRDGAALELGRWFP